MNMKNRTTDQIYDEWLVVRCQGRDQKALTELISRWNNRLSRYVWRLTSGHEDMADIVQEIWINAVRKLHQLRDPACFPQWVYRIATAQCANWTRRMKRNRRLQEAVNERNEFERGTQVTKPEAEKITALREGLKCLPPDQQILISLFYIDELSINAIAESLGIPTGTVKSRLFHVREALRRTIERGDQ